MIISKQHKPEVLISLQGCTFDLSIFFALAKSRFSCGNANLFILVKYVLEQLGLHIDVYYASEINATAELVTMFNHGFSVSQLGDVMKIDRNTVSYPP